MISESEVLWLVEENTAIYLKFYYILKDQTKQKNTQNCSSNKKIAFTEFKLDFE